MCLDKLKEFKTTKTTGVGWKVIHQVKNIGNNKNQYEPPIFRGKIFYKKKQWNKDTNSYTLNEHRFHSYPTGYHIFITKKDAAWWRKLGGPRNLSYLVKKVEYRKVVATGYQYDRKVVVAREFKFV